MFEKNKPDTNVKTAITAGAIGEMTYDSSSRRAMANACRITRLPRHRARHRLPFPP